MATLTLTRIWVNLLSTGEAVSGQSAPDRDQEHGMDGEVRTYAGGRQRAVTKEGVHSGFGFQLVAISKTDVDTLTSWIGQAVQVRDHRGQRFFGVYFRVAVGEYRDPTLWKAGISLQTVTHVEGV